jgi:K+-sensing histidine kinase KdpD
VNRERGSYFLRGLRFAGSELLCFLGFGRNQCVSPFVHLLDLVVGVGEGNRDDMFQAFYTTKADGMGMGLAIARSIVEAHGGRPEAHSNLGGGAIFSFTLPISDDGQ